MQKQTRIDTPKPAVRNVAVRYDQASITHTSQFLLSPSAEELIVDLSSGLIRESAENETLPIHTRLSMSWSTAERLADLLNQVVQRHKSSAGSAKPSRPTQIDRPIATGTPRSVPTPNFPQASIPSMNAPQGRSE
jgi:hypothetical protein